MSDSFDLFNDKFEGTILYRIGNKAKRESGIIKTTSEGAYMFFLVFEPEDDVPKKIIPAANMLEVTVSVGDPVDNDDSFELKDQTKAKVIHESSGYDVESRMTVGTDTLGDIELSEVDDNEVSY